MSGRKILCDVDGVLCDTVTAYLALVQEHTGRSHVLADVTDFRFSKCVVSLEEDAHIWQNMIDQRPGFVSSLPELPDAIAAIDHLRESAQVVALTSPHIGPHWMHERALWLMERGFAKRDIVFANNKAHVPGTVLIDDSLDNCREWAAAHPCGTAIVMDQPWNQGEVAGNMLRARNWDHAVALVQIVLEQSEPDLTERLDRALAAAESERAARGRAVNTTQLLRTLLEGAVELLMRRGHGDDARALSEGMKAVLDR